MHLLQRNSLQSNDRCILYHVVSLNLYPEVELFLAKTSGHFVRYYPPTLLTRPSQLAPLPINTPLQEPQAQGVAILSYRLSLLPSLLQPAPCASSRRRRMSEHIARAAADGALQGKHL
jgi:hypothetical protein